MFKIMFKIFDKRFQPTIIPIDDFRIVYLRRGDLLWDVSNSSNGLLAADAYIKPLKPFKIICEVKRVIDTPYMVVSENYQIPGNFFKIDQCVICLANSPSVFL